MSASELMRVDKHLLHVLSDLFSKNPVISTEEGRKLKLTVVKWHAKCHTAKKC